MRWGTSHFVSRSAAIRYYRDYFSSNANDLGMYVDKKVNDREIHIGKPNLVDGQVLTVIDNGTRYAIEISEDTLTGTGRTGSVGNARACGDEEVGR